MHSPSASSCHVVAMPFPLRSLINPMMNLCKLLISRTHDLLITFVVTEEWHSFMASDPKPDNIRFATIPIVIPPQRILAADISGFQEAVMTKMEAPFEDLLDRLEHPVSLIISESELVWAISLANRKNIPVASLWNMSTTIYNLINRYVEEKESQIVAADFSCNEDNQVNGFPGTISRQIAELKKVVENDKVVMEAIIESILWVPKANYFLLTSVHELESQAIDTLPKANINTPIYALGPTIPYFELKNNSPGDDSDYMKWLNCQPKCSVLYISFGSHLTPSKLQMDEMAAGLQDSGVRFLWVAREEASRMKECCGDKGLVIPWCNQLKVLSHPSVGGFWTHCGWNSTIEALFSGVPMLTFPLFLDQYSNSWLIEEHWNVGWKVKKIERKEIACLMQRFMDPSESQMIELRKRAKDIQGVCQSVIVTGGSLQSNLDAFIKDFSNMYNCSYEFRSKLKFLRDKNNGLYSMQVNGPNV